MGSYRRQVRPMIPVATPDSTVSGHSAWAGDRLADQVRRVEGSRGDASAVGYIGIGSTSRYLVSTGDSGPSSPGSMGAGENCLHHSARLASDETELPMAGSDAGLSM